MRHFWTIVKKHIFFRLFQYLVCEYTMLYLVDSIFVSNLESHFEKIERTKIGIAPNFAPWKKIGKKANHIVEIIS